MMKLHSHTVPENGSNLCPHRLSSVIYWHIGGGHILIHLSYWGRNTFITVNGAKSNNQYPERPKAYNPPHFGMAKTESYGPECDTHSCIENDTCMNLIIANHGLVYKSCPSVSSCDFG